MKIKTCLVVLALTLFSLVACDKDRNEPITLEAAEAALYNAGVDVEYYDNYQFGNCTGISSYDIRAVNRTEAGVNAAVGALRQYQNVLLRHCPHDREEIDDLIYRAISRLERCRISWRMNEQCR